jgi:hypothetical protein
LVDLDLTGWYFANQNLSYAYFVNSTLTGANFTGAIVKGAEFTAVAGFTAAQLYSTASYADRDLAYIWFTSLDLTGWNFANQKLANAYFFGSTLVNANFTGTSLTDASFDSTTLTGADFTGSDLRGAEEWSPAGTVTHNTIRPDGSIKGLSLLVGEELTVRNFTLPIRVNGSAAFDPSAELRIVLDGHAWGSTISFAAGTSVGLDGALDLDFVNGIDLAAQIGRTFDLFDWTGVSPTGSFTIDSPYNWDLSKLYTTGEVTLLSIVSTPGDFDADGDVDGADFVAWQTNFPKASGATLAQGDSDGDGDVDGADFVVWQTHFPYTTSPAASPVPEPEGVFMLSACALVMSLWRSCRSTIK